MKYLLAAGMTFLPLPASASECARMLSWIKPRQESLLDHPVEKRGFVQVPLDYATPETSPKLDIFYRLIPVEGAMANDPSKPLMVIFNGGPGMPNRYRKVDYDYDQMPHDQLTHLHQSYNILLVDQRGTNGGSAALDLSKPDIDPHLIARFFSDAPQALDHAAVIRAVRAPHQPLYVIAQSYGGHIGVRYMMAAEANPKAVPTPDAIIFASSSLPNQDEMASSLNRRRTQLRLNQELAQKYPTFVSNMTALRARVAALDPKSSYADSLFDFFIGGDPTQYDVKLMARLEELLKLNDHDLHEQMTQDNDPILLLNYILSPAIMMNGMTDRESSRAIIKQIPFESWMIDEARFYITVTGPNAVENALVDRIDADPPQALPKPTNEQIRKALSRTLTVFTMATDDGAVPIETYRESARKVAPANAIILVLKGGHRAIFGKEAYQQLLAHGIH